MTITTLVNCVGNLAQVTPPKLFPVRLVELELSLIVEPLTTKTLLLAVLQLFHIVRRTSGWLNGQFVTIFAHPDG